MQYATTSRFNLRHLSVPLDPQGILGISHRQSDAISGAENELLKWKRRAAFARRRRKCTHKNLSGNYEVRVVCRNGCTSVHPFPDSVCMSSHTDVLTTSCVYRGLVWRWLMMIKRPQRSLSPPSYIVRRRVTSLGELPCKHRRSSCWVRC